MILFANPGMYREKGKKLNTGHFLKKVPEPCSLAKLLILSLRLQPSTADNLDCRIRYQIAADILDFVIRYHKAADNLDCPIRYHEVADILYIRANSASLVVRFLRHKIEKDRKEGSNQTTTNSLSN